MCSFGHKRNNRYRVEDVLMATARLQECGDQTWEMRTRRVRDVSMEEKNCTIVNSCNKQTSRLRYVTTKYPVDRHAGRKTDKRARSARNATIGRVRLTFFNFRAATVSEWRSRSLDRHLLARRPPLIIMIASAYCLHGRRDGSEKNRRFAGGSRALVNGSNFYLGPGERARFSVSAGCEVLWYPLELRHRLPAH